MPRLCVVFFIISHSCDVFVVFLTVSDAERLKPEESKHRRSNKTLTQMIESNSEGRYSPRAVRSDVVKVWA